MESGQVLKSVGAFSGWKVLLCVDKSKQAGFKRLLEAGGAKVVASRPPFHYISGVTHAFLGSVVLFWIYRYKGGGGGGY